MDSLRRARPALFLAAFALVLASCAFVQTSSGLEVRAIGDCPNLTNDDHLSIVTEAECGGPTITCDANPSVATVGSNVDLTITEVAAMPGSARTWAIAGVGWGETAGGGGAGYTTPTESISALGGSTTYYGTMTNVVNGETNPPGLEIRVASCEVTVTGS